MKNIIYLLIIVLFSSSNAMAQTNSQNSFVNVVDQNLTIKSVMLEPLKDNVGGIYAKPVEEELKKILNNDLQWSLVPFSEKEHSSADATLATTLTKGSRGINGTLTLITTKDGLPLIQETLTDYKGFDIAEVNAEFKKMFMQLKSKLPFRGMILSRRGQDVTLNLGSNYGLRSGSNVTIVQIVKVNRHPKLQFMIGNEKEVLGRVLLTKVDKNLSFGSIVFEREVGVIAPGGKVLPEEFVKYTAPTIGSDGKIISENAAYGDKPKEWQPEAPPQFGKASLLAGFSSYEQNTDLTSGTSITAKNGFAPNIAVRGEMWIDSNWFIAFGLRQSVFSVSNDLNGSSPSRLNMALGQYGVNGGYNFLLSNDFFGPKMQVNLGFLTTKFSADSSSPTAFTTMEYGGFQLGLGGQFPVSDQIPLAFGANFNLWLNSNLGESPSSGSSSNSINSFGFFLDYHYRPKVNLKTELNFEYYKSDFTGSSRTGSSHKLTTLLVGIEYLF